MFFRDVPWSWISSAYTLSPASPAAAVTFGFTSSTVPKVLTLGQTDIELTRAGGKCENCKQSSPKRPYFPCYMASAFWTALI